MALRILHVTPYCEAAWGYGGIPRVVGAMTRELARRGHRVTVMTTDARDAASRLRPGEEQVEGIETLVFPNVSNALAYHQQLFLPRGFADAMGRMARDFDVAHLHGFRNMPVAMASHALEMSGVPWLLQPNGTAPRIERRRLAKLVFDMFVDRRSLRGASRLVAVTEAERRQFHRMGVGDERIRRVPNPVENHESTLAHGAFRRVHQIGEAPLVAYLGKLTPRKRVDVLIDAFAKLGRGDARLVLAGNDMGAEATLRRRARSLGVAAIFTGQLEGSHRLELLADADVVVYPSKDEIFGIVPLEALLCGTPVLVAGDSGCGETIAGLGLDTWVLPLGQAGALASAVAAILGNLEAARGKAVAAARRVKELYSPGPVVDALERVYAEVVNA